MRKLHIGRCHDLTQIDPKNEDAKSKLLQAAIGEALMEAGIRISRDVEKERFVPVSINFEILEQGWDLQVRITMEDEDGNKT